MKDPRWTAISESAFAWEKEALDWLRDRLPERDPWHAWSNFEFIDDEGKVNEVDTLILSPLGLFLVEIKSRPGSVSGDAHTWTWRTDGRDYAYDNPLILANRKAKRLASLLRRQSSVVKARSRVPFIEPLIFLSAINAEGCKLAGNGRSGVFLKGRPDGGNDEGIVAKLSGTGNYPPSGPLIGHELARVVCRAVVEAGVRPSNKHRRIGDYQLGAVIQEGENYQDWEGTHVSAGVRRRVRIYGYSLAANSESRQALVRQATREFQILEGIDHPGILRVRDFKESELGPALVFDFNPRERRLDFLLREQGANLSVDQKLAILRQLAETLKYAHQKKLIHRALSPHSVLVLNQDSADFKLAIMNWQLATRGSLGNQSSLTSYGSAEGTLMRTAGTKHVDEYLEDPAKLFLAPEAMWEGAPVGPHLDVFSLGVIAWQVFAGDVPAANVSELHQKLKAGSGLRISDVIDGAGKSLQDLIQFSTCPDVSARLATVTDFLEYLELVEDELTAPAELATVDPATAKSGDLLDGDFRVERRLGRGSSSDVLLVKRAGSDEELVLKVALDATHNTRLIAEGETLNKLRHANVVEWRETLTVAGRTALLMKSAGKETLAYHLRNNRPSLDLVRRFGEELLQVAVYLEDQGVYHRDIKPDNIGLCPSSHSGRLQLVLFDFSLAKTSVDNVQAGTRPYLDPFLGLRKPPRWDVYAERFAIAMTLYEMVTGLQATWGDGQSEPALIEDEVSLDVSLFDPNLRDGLMSFFTKALRREFRERFDNAEDMLREWRRIFDQADTRVPTDPFETIAHRATRETAIAELGYSIEAQNVLDRMGIHNVRELLSVDRVRFRYLKSVGDKVRKEIRSLAKRLAQLRPDLATAGAPTVLDVDATGTRAGIRSIDELANHLMPKRAASEERADDDALALYLGLETGDAGSENELWPTLGAAAGSAGISRPALTNALVVARARWLKSPVMTEVREELAATLGLSGGAMSAQEAAAALLASRGSIEQDDGLRLRISAAVLRAAIESEADLAEPRFLVSPGLDKSAVPLIAASMDHADYALRLGAAADSLIEGEQAANGVHSLPAPQQVVEALEIVERPHTVAPLSIQRLVKLSACSSRHAAVSSRLELYPRNMAAQRAIRIALGSILGLRVLTETQLRERILGRYPEAEALPSRPSLDALLAAAGADLVWRQDGEHGPGYYAAHQGFGPTAGTTTFLHRPGTVIDHEVTTTIEADIRERLAVIPDLDASLNSEWQAAKDAGRSGATLHDFKEEAVTQSAVHWLLMGVFIRFLEDNGLIDRPFLTAADSKRRELAQDRHETYFRQHPGESDREYLLAAFREVGTLPAMGALFDEQHNPLFRLEVSGDGAMAILGFWQKINPDSGELVHDFTDADWNTRFLGDLYQDLSETAQKKFALLQTPEFVEEFILDRTLTPAIHEFGYREVRLIDPTCGSGHFLLGGFARLLEKWQRNDPGRNARDIVQRALDAIHGVDLNPFAIAISRFRLLVAALNACGENRLAEAPNFRFNLAAGDSLLHGPRLGRGQLELGGEAENLVGRGFAHAYASEDLFDLNRILGQRYHAVVGNPPYITVKDAVLNAAYRNRYASCHRQYSLGVPFTERFFELAVVGGDGQPAGYVGLITANSFMKREFGKKLIEDFFPRTDLTHVIDTAGAYIPGHGTPTVVLFGRERVPVGSEVRSAMGIKGEPSTPENPALGLVWSAIVNQIDHPGSQSEFMSVGDIPRRIFAIHPWSIGGGGATHLLDHLNLTSELRLGSLTLAIGRTTHTGSDDVYFFDQRTLERKFDGATKYFPLVEGDVIRDWAVAPETVILFPYDHELRPSLTPNSLLNNHLWLYKQQLARRREPGGTHEEVGLTWFEWSRFQRERFIAPLGIVFAEVATHNHFAFNQDKRVSTKSAPAIKLPINSSENDYLELLGLLNSSVACFWFKQVCHNKGSTVDQYGARQRTAPFEDFYDFTPTKVAQFPLVDVRPTEAARSIAQLSLQLGSTTPGALLAMGVPSKATLQAGREQNKYIQRQLIAKQEDLDWHCYQLYGLTQTELTHPNPPAIAFGERAFEIILARRMAAGQEQSTWFVRHGSTPVTELPANWPADYRRVVEARISLIEKDKFIGLIERPEYKRRWASTPWQEQEQAALKIWLLDRLEAALKIGAVETATLTTTNKLADTLRADADFMQVAALYAERSDFDVAILVAELAGGDAVPVLPILRYKESGLRKRAAWEQTWALQRREDAGENVGDIPVPPKYKSADFQKADYWRLRGGLDVPKERFFSFPNCSRDADGSLLIAWAGLNPLHLGTAIATHYLDMKDNEGRDAERLKPLLAAIAELAPWIKQWHNEPDAEHGTRMGDYLDGFVDEECRSLGVTRAAVIAWQPPATTARRGRRSAT